MWALFLNNHTLIFLIYPQMITTKTILQMENADAAGQIYFRVLAKNDFSHLINWAWKQNDIIILVIFMEFSICCYKPKEFFSFFIGVQLLYNVMLISAVAQSESAVCIHMSSSSWAFLPPIHPHLTPLSHHGALSWAPCAIQRLPTSYLFYAWWCIRQS